MAKRVEVLIKPDGTVEVDAIGYSGTECLAATREVEVLLGGAVTSRRVKPEMARVSARAKAHNGAGGR